MGVGCCGVGGRCSVWAGCSVWAAGQNARASVRQTRASNARPYDIDFSSDEISEAERAARSLHGAAVALGRDSFPVSSVAATPGSCNMRKGADLMRL